MFFSATLFPLLFMFDTVLLYKLVGLNGEIIFFLIQRDHGSWDQLVNGILFLPIDRSQITLSCLIRNLKLICLLISVSYCNQFVSIPKLFHKAAFTLSVQVIFVFLFKLLFKLYFSFSLLKLVLFHRLLHLYF
jgi:hypothetical protein